VEIHSISRIRSIIFILKRTCLGNAALYTAAEWHGQALLAFISGRDEVVRMAETYHKLLSFEGRSSGVIFWIGDWHGL
jgi:hypothetical protein